MRRPTARSEQGSSPTTRGSIGENPGTLSDGLSSICKGPKVTAETTLGWYTVIPFAALLLCIAILPLIPATERWWDSNRSKLLLALALGIPVALYITVLDGPIPVADALVEYAQFIILLLSLFVISGGIHLAGDIRANPGVNTLFLGFGARSEEHTSELQSRGHLVCRLLLEKKKKEKNHSGKDEHSSNKRRSDTQHST